MRKYLFIGYLSIILASCTGKGNTPSGILPSPKMQSVLWDLMRADKYLNDYAFTKDTSLDKIKESLRYYQQIFTLHDITREKFQKSFLYYKSHPGLLKQVLDSIAAPPVAAPLRIIDSEESMDTVSFPKDTITIKIPPKKDSATTIPRKKVQQLMN